MPCPVAWYQPPAGVIPACFHRSFSRALVPESSPRDTNSACAAAIFATAPTLSRPRTPAGSLAGPTSTKSLCITNRRCPAVPSATNACSAAGECTSSTSASPRRPSSMAWPLPTASVLTCHPLSRVNCGSSSSSSPESWVLVVVARISDFSAEGPAAGGAGSAWLPHPTNSSTAARTRAGIA